MTQSWIRDGFYVLCVVGPLFVLRLWLQVAELRDREEIRRRLPHPSSFFFGGVAYWIWTGQHRAVADAPLSQTVLVLRVLFVLAPVLWLAGVATSG